MDASSSSSTAESQHQVFISFRGADVRNDFLHQLVLDMRSSGINVFIDADEVRGMDLQDLFLRIEESEVALVIFSDNYTNSEWCLKELAKINECVGKRTLVAFPIFYKVTASQVKIIEGEFGVNFRSLKRANHYDTAKTRQWEKAITNISGKHGMELLANSNIEGKQFRELVIQEVQRLLEHIRKNTDEKGQSEATRNRQPEAVQISQCVMFSARDLKISNSHNARYWAFMSITESPNEAPKEVAKMGKSCWYLEVCGKLDARELVPGKRYEVVFVVKVEDTMTRWVNPVTVELMVPDKALQEREFQFDDLVRNEWVDIQAGVFDAQPHKEKIAFYLYQHQSNIRMTGLVVKGVIIRPME